jgi:hypothetical protein
MPRKTNARVKSKPPKPSSKPKGKSRRVPISNIGFYQGLSSTFGRALKDPFDPDSLGCRVPDPFSFPTATYHVHGNLVIGTGGSGSATSGSVLLLPNPNLSLVDLSGTVVTTGMNQFASTTFCYGATNPTALGSVLATYRVVSCGFKISNLQPELSATGRLIIAPFVVPDTIPSFNQLSANPTTVNNLSLNVVGSSSTNLTSSAVLDYPESILMVVQDLLHGDIELGCSVVSPQFFSFKNALPNNTYATGLLQGDSFTESTAGVVVAPGFKDDDRSTGGVGYIVYYEGLPTGATSAFDIEYIYHLEGTPEIGGVSAKINPVPSVLPQSCVGSTATVENALMATQGKNAFTWVASGAQFLNKVSKSATGKGILANAETLVGMHPAGNMMLRAFGRR